MSVFDKKKLKEALKPLVIETYKKQEEEPDIYKNTLDCFSAVIEASIRGITLEEWIESEKERQAQKTLQNKIGEFHQKAIATIEGVEDLGVGGVVDIICREKKIVAEIKNKWNTTKGNHKNQIYDDLLMQVQANEGYIGYYVEILSKKGLRYDKPYIPSDNRTKQRRPLNENIRVIDGRSFYELLTGKKDALKEMYLLLPDLTSEILRESYGVTKDSETLKKSQLFNELFENVFESG